MNPRRPGDPPPPNSKTRAGYVIPNEPQIDEFDDPATTPQPVLYEPHPAPATPPRAPAPAAPRPPASAPGRSPGIVVPRPGGGARPASIPPAPAHVAAPAAAPIATPDAGLSRPKPPPIEVEYIHETDLVAARTAQWPMLEIWTRNRIYHVDTAMICMAVINRATGQVEPTHSLKGAKLTGGERRSKSTQAVEIYFPFPMPGTEAVFRNEAKRNGSYGHTSTIERVVLRVRKMRVGSIDSTQAFDEITGRFTVR